MIANFGVNHGKTENLLRWCRGDVGRARSRDCQEMLMYRGGYRRERTCDLQGIAREDARRCRSRL